MQYLCSIGSLESCCKSASSLPKFQFFYTKYYLPLSSDSRENMLFERYNFTIGIFSFPSQTVFHLRGREISSCFFALYFWVLSSSIWNTWITFPHTSKKKRKMEGSCLFFCMKNSDLLCSARLSGESLHLCLCFRKELTSHCLY